MRIEYLAGLLEGEGWFGLVNQSSPSIELQMTDRDVVERVFHAYPTTQKFTVRDKNQYKTSYTYRISGRPAVDIMVELYPHMGLRRQERIRSVIDSWAARTMSTQIQCSKCGRLKIADNATIEWRNHPTRIPGRRCRTCRNESLRARRRK